MDSKSRKSSRQSSKSLKSKSSRNKRSKTSRSSKLSTRRSSKRSSNSTRKSSKSSRKSKKTCSKSLNSDLTKLRSKARKNAKKAEKRARNQARKEAFESQFDILERPDGFGALVVYVYQLLHLIYCVSALSYYSFFKNEPTSREDLQAVYWTVCIEIISMCIILLTLFYRTPGFRSFVLLVQYIYAFYFWSIFFKVMIDYEIFSTLSIPENLFGLQAISVLSAILHSFILCFTMDFVGCSELDDDFSSKYIIETKEKRKQKIYLLVAEFLKSYVVGNGEEQGTPSVGVMVTDETGNPVKIDGSVIKSDVNRKISLTLAKDSMQLSSTNVVESTLAVPSQKEEPIQKIQIIQKNEPVYNHVAEQKNYLSPRTL